MYRIVFFYYKKFIKSFPVIFSSVLMFVLMFAMISYAKILIVVNTGGTPGVFFNSLNATTNFVYMLPIFGALIFVVTFLSGVYFSKNENSNIDSQILSIVNNRNKFVFGKIIAVITFIIVWSIVAGMFMFFITFLDLNPKMSLRFNYSLGFTLALIILTLILAFTFMALKTLLSSIVSVVILFTTFVGFGVTYYTLLYNSGSVTSYYDGNNRDIISSPYKTAATTYGGDLLAHKPPWLGIPQSGWRKSAWNYLNNFDPISGFVNIASSRYDVIPSSHAYSFYEAKNLPSGDSANFTITANQLQTMQQEINDIYIDLFEEEFSSKYSVRLFTEYMLYRISVKDSIANLPYSVSKKIKKYTSKFDLPMDSMMVSDVVWMQEMNQFQTDHNLHLNQDQLPINHFPRALGELLKETNKELYNFPEVKQYFDKNFFSKIVNEFKHIRIYKIIEEFSNNHPEFLPTNKLLIENLVSKNSNDIINEMNHIDHLPDALFYQNSNINQQLFIYPVRTGNNWLIIWLIYLGALITLVITVEFKKDFR